MKIKTNPNDKAFQEGTVGSNTLTKREYFAALALQGMLAKVGSSEAPLIVATNTLAQVDELIKQLTKTSQA